MSKKETEFDRLSRMKKMQKEASVEKRKLSFDDDESDKKKRKPKVSYSDKRIDDYEFDDEFEYI